MQLEEYFEFRGEDEIRIRGTRVGLEIVLAEYLSGRTPEEIASQLPRPNVGADPRQHHILPAQPACGGPLPWTLASFRERGEGGPGEGAS